MEREISFAVVHRRDATVAMGLGVPNFCRHERSFKHAFQT